MTQHDSLSKRLNEKEKDAQGRYAFVNINRSFQWLDLSWETKADPLCKILLAKAHVLCHDVNSQSKDSNHVDVVVGSSTGDILWWEAISQKYARINKNGGVNGSPVSHIKWVPGSENLFLAAHMDGALVVYDKEKEDAAVLLTDETGAERNNNVFGGHENDDGNSRSNGLKVVKSVNSANQKSNPVSYWGVSDHRVNAFEFSPDSRHLAVVSEDGCLRVIDYLRERYFP